MKNTEFLKAVDTLKLYRRAELVDEMGHELISDLYVDPLPDNHVLQTLLRPNTTFLIGRKRKLPRQGDTSKGELRASSWARYKAGGRPANASWGRSSL